MDKELSKLILFDFDHGIQVGLVKKRAFFTVEQMEGLLEKAYSVSGLGNASIIDAAMENFPDDPNEAKGQFKAVYGTLDIQEINDPLKFLEKQIVLLHQNRHKTPEEKMRLKDHIGQRWNIRVEEIKHLSGADSKEAKEILKEHHGHDQSHGAAKARRKKCLEMYRQGYHKIEIAMETRPWVEDPTDESVLRSVAKDIKTAARGEEGEYEAWLSAVEKIESKKGCS